MILGVGIDVVDIARFGESLERTPGAARAGCSPPAERGAAAGVAGRPVRRQGGARQGARRARPGMALARRRGGQRGRPADPRFEHPRHRCSPAPTSSGVAQRPRLALPRRRDRLGRGRARVLTMTLAAERFEAFGGAAPRAASALFLVGAVGAGAARARRSGGPTRAPTFGRVLAVVIACVDRAEPGVPADARRLRASARRCPLQLCDLALGRGRVVGAVDAGTGCRPR